MSASEAGAVERTATLSVESPVFNHNGNIPDKYTCYGPDVNPPLVIRNVPAAAETLALIVDDPDAPAGTWVHWVMWNIPVSDTIEEDSVPGQEGTNDFRETRYHGPCPPSGMHRYFFRVYALDTYLPLQPGANRYELEQAMETHILAQGELVGLYSGK